jgi:RNA polymerase sigma factor (sigma-70 family)
MPITHLNGLRRAAALLSPDSAPDGELLARFVNHRDEAAFVELVRRHGAMVFGTCRRILGNVADADDAFQATFVVLVRKGPALTDRVCVANYLYRVAFHTALKVKAMAAKRRLKESRAKVPEAALDQTELLKALDDELIRLPEKYRQVVLACELEGRSRQDAAKLLGIPEGTISSRLATAHRMLEKRLRSRGFAAVCIASVLAGQVSAVVTNSLTETAVKGVLGPTQKVSQLVTEVTKMLLLHKLGLGALILAAVLVVVVGIAAADPLDPASPPSQTFARLTDAPASTPSKVEAVAVPKEPNKILVSQQIVTNGKYRQQLALIDPEGKNDPTIIDDTDLLLLPDVRISPDGKKLAALVQTPHVPGDGLILKLCVRGLGKKEPWSDLGVECQSFAWSPDSTELVCSNSPHMFSQEQSPDATHFVVNVTTRQKTELKLSADHVISDWSRDGKFFLTTSVTARVGGLANQKVVRVHLMNRDGTEHETITDGTQPAMFGRLSPDGKQVLYSIITLPAGAPEEDRLQILGEELAILDVASGKVGRVQESGDIYSYCWSPDGKRIAYTWREAHKGKFVDLLDKDTECCLVVCDPNGKNRKTLAKEKGRGPTPVPIGVGDWR